VQIDLAGRAIELEVPFPQAHLRSNLLAAVAAASAIGVIPSGRVEVAFSPGRGQRTELPGGVTVIDDSYNANPMSVRAALQDLVATAPPGGAARRVAVLGDMLELGPDERAYHLEAGRQAAEVGVDLLVTVGPRAAAMVETFCGESYGVATAAQAAPLVRKLVQPGDVVLVKGSRGVGLEAVCSALTAAPV
jgi:UDP-N-acetylmuramoyl-tripeptide--D-alanyl-D-alanine ligase